MLKGQQIRDWLAEEPQFSKYIELEKERKRKEKKQEEEKSKNK